MIHQNPHPTSREVAWVFRQLLNSMASEETFDDLVTKRLGLKDEDIVPLERAGGTYVLDVLAAAHTDRLMANTDRIAKLEARLASASRFTLFHMGTRCVSADWAPQMDGSVKWAVRDAGWCLGKGLEWEYEPMPSSRDDDFLARCRFDTLDEAMHAGVEALKQEALEAAKEIAEQKRKEAPDVLET